MLHIVLFEPEIPPNTGNIIRLCANNGCKLHLIKPLGFDLNEKQCRRAGLDYQQIANEVTQYNNFDEFLALNKNSRLFACSTKGEKFHSEVVYQAEDFLLFGPETRGLPAEVLAHPAITEIIKIPMQPSSRSLNLSNAAAIISYEAWRQLDYC